jgi:hypothetical protein
MMAQELIDRAQALCRHRRSLPAMGASIFRPIFLNMFANGSGRDSTSSFAGTVLSPCCRQAAPFGRPKSKSVDTMTTYKAKRTPRT